jgi:L-ascorbate metabolism protein UlaG (beta-lactamase superfamily)
MSIHTMGWYDIYKTKALDISFTPSRHYCRRPDTPFNEQLWGGFIIQSATPGSKAVYFGGDSGYDNKLFTDIKELYAPSVAMLGIGAFKPYYFMHPNHTGPAEALQAFKDCGAAVMIPMHYATFFLGNEMAEEPLATLKELQREEQICITQPGETIQLKPWIGI